MKTIDEIAGKVIKEQILIQFGNPEYYFEAYVNDDGWYVKKTKIEKIEIAPRYSGGYTVKINGSYVIDSYFLFDEKEAEKYIKKCNKEYWTKEIERCEKELVTIDSDTIKRKARLNATIEIGKNKLEKLKEVGDE